MGRTLFETADVSAPTSGRAFGWPVSAGIHVVFVGILAAASALATGELPPLRPDHGIVRLPVVLQRESPPAALPRRGNPLPPRSAGQAHPPPVAAPRPTTPPRLVDPAELPSDVRQVDLPADRAPGLPACAGCVPWGDPNGLVGGADPFGGAALPPRPPLRVSAGITPPRKIHDVEPAYPSLALSVRLEGRVVIDCVIGVDGRVDEVRVLQGHPLLTEAAADAVRRWRYAPALLSGEPVAVIMSVTVDFRLSR